MKCFGCDGDGKIRGFACPGFLPVEIHCDGCDGTGELPDEAASWVEEGEKLRKSRMEPYRNVRDEARRRGIDMVELSLMERGMRKPIFS